MVDSIKYLLQQKNLLPTLIFIPALYFLGWIITIPFFIIFADYYSDQIRLFGTIITFFLFVILLPAWTRFRWRQSNPWQLLGLAGSSKRVAFSQLLQGFLLAVVLILFILIALLYTSSGIWLGFLSGKNLLNAIFLGFGVGFAEELVFRSWLWLELKYLYSPRYSLVLQALIFSLAHIRFDLNLPTLIGLCLGLFLLGIVLALFRKFNDGSLWTCIGFHGGLVGLWFAVSNDLVVLSPNPTWWILGTGDGSFNPIGGYLGIVILTLVLMVQFFALAIVRNPVRGALKDSSKEDLP